MSLHSTAHAARAPEPRPQPGRLLQRKCACGSHTVAGAPCASCAEEEKTTIQRRPGARGRNEAVPPIVHAVLRAPGEPLDPATRTFMEPRFVRDFSSVRASAQPMRSALTVGPPDDVFEHEADGMAAQVATTPASARRRDFGDVRIHADAAAAESARAVDAQAYTVGRDIVFGAGQYRPRSAAGRALIAHELAHVAQQGSAPGVLRRKGTSPGGFFANLFQFWDYSTDDLQAYLRVLDAGEIEDDDDSDDKARQIVEEWMVGGSPYALTEKRKALLIREMLTGATLDSDEVAIVELLERSYNFELGYIFGAGGIAPAELDSKIEGGEKEFLNWFYDRRFDGGHEAVLAGNLKPIGEALPLGAARILPGHSESIALPDAHGQWNLACVLGLLCAEDKDVVAKLAKLTVRVAKVIVEHYWRYEGGTWIAKKRERGAAHKPRSKVVILTEDKGCAGIVENIIHEVRHRDQPDNMDPVQVETDAYTFTEEWTIKRGIPGRSEFRKTKPESTEEVVDTDAIEAYVKGNYSGHVEAEKSDRIIGHLPNGKTKIKHADGSETEESPKEGDEHQDVDKTEAGLQGLRKYEPADWTCPKEPEKEAAP